MPTLERTDRAILLVLVVLVSSVYFATFVGVTSSNDGSHYALLRALVDHRHFEISEYLSFTEYQDYAMNGARRYSDRPPGTALWAAPFYAVGRLLPEPILVPPSKHDAGQPLLMGIAAATALAGALAVGLFYLILRQHFKLVHTAALLAALGLAFGTVLWKYGSVLYSHSLGTLIVFLALYLTGIVLRNRTTSLRLWAALGLTIGASVLVEYTNILLVVFLGGFLSVWIARGSNQPRRWQAWIALMVCIAIPGLLLMGYNTLNFGGPLELSTFHVDTTIWPQNENMSTDFATPFRVGLQGLLLWGSNNQGLLLLSPLSWLALPGFVLLWRHSRRDFALVGGLFLVFLLLFSKSTTFNSLTNDGRYLTPFIGLWFVPLAFWLDRVYVRMESDMARAGWALLFFGLFFLSIRNVFMHIALSWNYDLDLAQLQPFSAHPSNLRYVLGTVFPNAINVWWLWWLQGVVYLVGWGVWKLLLWKRVPLER